jgi:phage tail-like protein
VYVSLLNENHDPVISWQFFRAWPVKLVSSDLKASDSALAIETLELAFSYMNRVFNDTSSS